MQNLSSGGTFETSTNKIFNWLKKKNCHHEPNWKTSTKNWLKKNPWTFTFDIRLFASINLSGHFCHFSWIEWWGQDFPGFNHVLQLNLWVPRGPGSSSGPSSSWATELHALSSGVCPVCTILVFWSEPKDHDHVWGGGRSIGISGALLSDFNLLHHNRKIQQPHQCKHSISCWNVNFSDEHRDSSATQIGPTTFILSRTMALTLEVLIHSPLTSHTAADCLRKHWSYWPNWTKSRDVMIPSPKLTPSSPRLNLLPSLLSGCSTLVLVVPASCLKSSMSQQGVTEPLLQLHSIPHFHSPPPDFSKSPRPTGRGQIIQEQSHPLTSDLGPTGATCTDGHPFYLNLLFLLNKLWLVTKSSSTTSRGFGSSVGFCPRAGALHLSLAQRPKLQHPQGCSPRPPRWPGLTSTSGSWAAGEWTNLHHTATCDGHRPTVND